MRRSWNSLGWRSAIERAFDAGKIVSGPDQLGEPGPIQQSPFPQYDEPSLLAVIVANVLAYAVAILLFLVIVGSMYYFLGR